MYLIRLSTVVDRELKQNHYQNQDGSESHVTIHLYLF
jgi:hypothetical protein